jgi:hypothetical protein
MAIFKDWVLKSSRMIFCQIFLWSMENLWAIEWHQDHRNRRQKISGYFWRKNFWQKFFSLQTKITLLYSSSHVYSIRILLKHFVNIFNHLINFSSHWSIENKINNWCICYKFNIFQIYSRIEGQAPLALTESRGAPICDARPIRELNSPIGISERRFRAVYMLPSYLKVRHICKFQKLWTQIGLSL